MAFLLLHGLGADRNHPIDLVSPVLPKEPRMLAPDIRAHGSSTLVGGAADFALDALAREVAESLPRDESHTVIGISMGAAIGLRLALLPGLPIDRLVAIRPAFTDIPSPQNLAVFPIIGTLLSHFGAVEGERLFRKSQEYAALAALSPYAAASALEQFRQPDAVGRAIRLIKVPKNVAYVSAAELAALDLPVTVLAAPRDPVHPVAIAEKWSRDIPGAKLVSLPARDTDMRAYVRATRDAVADAISEEN